MTIAEMFEKYADEHGEFERIPIAERLFEAPELCALTYISGLMKDPSKFEYHTKHDTLYLPSISKLKKLTEEDVIFLRHSLRRRV